MFPYKESIRLKIWKWSGHTPFNSSFINFTVCGRKLWVNPHCTNVNSYTT